MSSSEFTYAAFYHAMAVQAAEKLAQSAAAFAANPSGENAARLKMDADYWRDAQSCSRNFACHNL